MNYVEHLTVPNSYRVQGIKVKFPQQNFVFINTYFPTDPRIENFDDTELIETLEDIKYPMKKPCDRFRFRQQSVQTNLVATAKAMKPCASKGIMIRTPPTPTGGRQLD